MFLLGLKDGQMDGWMGATIFISLTQNIFVGAQKNIYCPSETVWLRSKVVFIWASVEDNVTIDEMVGA